ncbi:unnamed protein product, partial [Rotaria magnacalcarata]
MLPENVKQFAQQVVLPEMLERSLLDTIVQMQLSCGTGLYQYESLAMTLAQKPDTGANDQEPFDTVADRNTQLPFH